MFFQGLFRGGSKSADVAHVKPIGITLVVYQMAIESGVIKALEGTEGTF